MNLKQQMAKDVFSVFMNPNEFAEVHTVTTYDKTKGNIARQLKMIIEAFTLDGRPLQYAEGVSVHNVVVHIEERILGFTPRVDQDFGLDGVWYRVTGVSNDTGIVKIVLQANGKRP